MREIQGVVVGRGCEGLGGAVRGAGVRGGIPGEREQKGGEEEDEKKFDGRWPHEYENT